MVPGQNSFKTESLRLIILEIEACHARHDGLCLGDGGLLFPLQFGVVLQQLGLPLREMTEGITRQARRLLLTLLPIRGGRGGATPRHDSGGPTAGPAHFRHFGGAMGAEPTHAEISIRELSRSARVAMIVDDEF